MVEAQKESLQMIIWSIILFQVEKNISELATISTRVSCVFAYKKIVFRDGLLLQKNCYYIYVKCFLLKILIIIP